MLWPNSSISCRRKVHPIFKMMWPKELGTYALCTMLAILPFWLAISIGNYICQIPAKSFQYSTHVNTRGEG
jgi:hypothetical protein